MIFRGWLCMDWIWIDGQSGRTSSCRECEIGGGRINIWTTTSTAGSDTERSEDGVVMV